MFTYILYNWKRTCNIRALHSLELILDQAFEKFSSKTVTSIWPGISQGLLNLDSLLTGSVLVAYPIFETNELKGTPFDPATSI